MLNEALYGYLHNKNTSIPMNLTDYYVDFYISQ